MSIPVLAAAWLFVQASDSTKKVEPPATIAELETRIRKVLDSTKTPGVGLAIVRHDSVIYTGGIGRARVSPERPVTAATLFRIGSTSKSFVGLTALALQQEGKLSLQDPVRKHLPGFYYVNPWEATDTLRLVHLLEHTSGFDDNSIKSYASSDPTPLTLEQGLALDSATRVSRWRPGTRFSYCNTGPAIVARVIEVIEKRPFEQVVQERWFGPLGMGTATYFQPDTSRVDAATLYRGDGMTAVPYWHVFIRPAGSINASARDMAAYLRFLLGRGSVDGKVLLPRAALDRMERPESWLGARAGIGVGYGLHLYRVADSLGYVWTEHNGGVEGGISDLSFLPDLGVGYAFQINSGNGVAATEITNLVRSYVRRGVAPRAEPSLAAVPAGIQREFSGWYRGVSPRQQHLDLVERLVSIAHVSVGDSSIRVSRLGKPVLMIAVDSLRFRRAGEATSTLALVRDGANGRPHGIESFGAGLGGSSERINTLNALAQVSLTAGWLLGIVLALLALVSVPVRWIVRRLRRRQLAPSAARPYWRIAMLSAVLVLANVMFLSVATQDIHEFGTLSAISIGFFASGIGFGLVAIAGAAFLVKQTRAESRWGRLSLTTARVVLVLNAVAAVYMTYKGYIGWRTWA